MRAPEEAFPMRPMTTWRSLPANKSMNETTNTSTSRLNYAIATLWNSRWFLIVPTVLCTLMAFAYGVTRSPSWTASQSLIIRDDLVGDPSKPGRFESTESLKSAQETVQEIARKPVVLRAALQKLGQEKSFLSISDPNWPDQETIEDVQKAVAIKSPGGTEFGKSEVIILSAKSSSPERAKQFAELIIQELEARIQEVRASRIQSMTAERQQTFLHAQNTFEESAGRLQKMDASFGADLSTIRSMNDQNGGDGPLQRSLSEIRLEKRAAESDLDATKVQRELLVKALDRPEHLTATSSELLQMQPRLQQLVAGLNEAEIKLSQLVGKFREKHPELINGRDAVVDIKMQIQKEIIAAIESIGTQIEVAQRQYDRKTSEEARIDKQLSEIANVRVDYSRLEQEVEKKSQILASAREHLSELQSFSSSSPSAGLLTLVGDIQVPSRADGLSWKMMTALGMLGGFLAGIGLIILFAPPFQPDFAYPTPPIANDFASAATGMVAAAGAKVASMRDTAQTAATAPSAVSPTASLSTGSSQLPADLSQEVAPFVQVERIAAAGTSSTAAPAPTTNFPVAMPPVVSTQPTVTPPNATQTMANPATAIQPIARQPGNLNASVQPPPATNLNPADAVSTRDQAFASEGFSPAETVVEKPGTDSGLETERDPETPRKQAESPQTSQTSLPQMPVHPPVTAVENQAATIQTSEPAARHQAQTINVRSGMQTVDIPSFAIESTVAASSEPAQEKELTLEEILTQKLDASNKPSAEDIVREIRRRQMDSSSSREAAIPTEPAEPAPHADETANPLLNTGKLTVEVRKRGSQPDPATDSAPQANRDAPKKNASKTPIPDQIKSLSQSIASFCEPLRARTDMPQQEDNF